MGDLSHWTSYRVGKDLRQAFYLSSGLALPKCNPSGRHCTVETRAGFNWRVLHKFAFLAWAPTQKPGKRSPPKILATGLTIPSIGGLEWDRVAMFEYRWWYSQKKIRNNQLYSALYLQALTECRFGDWGKPCCRHWCKLASLQQQRCKLASPFPSESSFYHVGLYFCCKVDTNEQFCSKTKARDQNHRHGADLPTGKEEEKEVQQTATHCKTAILGPQLQLFPKLKRPVHQEGMLGSRSARRASLLWAEAVGSKPEYPEMTAVL